MNSASATTITVNTSIFTAGQLIYVTNKGVGVCTITAGTATVSTTGTLALAQFASGVLYCISAGVFIFEAYAVSSTSGVVQVKSTAKTSTFTTSSATFVDVTGLSVAITPTSASNKVLVIAQIAFGLGEADPFGHFKLSGGNTSAYVGDLSGNRVRAVFGGFFSPDGENCLLSGSIVFLDSPATTSATTYVVQARAGTAGSARVNVSSTNSDNASVTSGASSITVYEVTP